MIMFSRRVKFFAIAFVVMLVINMIYQFSVCYPTHSNMSSSGTSVDNGNNSSNSSNNNYNNPTFNKLNGHNFKYILNPSNLFTNKPKVELIICVPISRANFEQRRAISETWGSYAYEDKNNAFLLFFIGNRSDNESPEIEMKIQNESRQYNNIVQADYIDSYRNLSLKSISILRWVSTYCPQTSFVLKADDDMYVNIPYLMPMLRSTKTKLSNADFIMGRVIEKAKPIRDKASKWHTDKTEFSDRFYPRYTSGTSYAMSGVTARLLYLASKQTPLFWLEDIYITGMCARKAGTVVVHNSKMTYDKPKPNGCVFRKTVSGHRYSVAQIRLIHAQIQNISLKC